MRQISVGNKSLAVPAMVPSVSSFETQLSPHEGLHIQNLIREPISLVSAYDLRDHPPDLEAICAEFRETSILLLDSGGYESSRIGHYAPAAKTSWNFQRFKAVSNRVVCDLVFSFDYFIEPGESVDQFGDRLIREFKNHHTFLQVQQLIPVVHLQSADGQIKLPESESAKLMTRIASELWSLFIAVPERELGPGLIAKVKLTRRIIESIKGVGNTPALHILGCGNLLSYAFLAAAGAEMFDGLEWCRTCTSTNFHLHHFQHKELFDPPPDAVPNISADFYMSATSAYQAKLAIRNLKAIQSFQSLLQENLQNKTVDTLVEANFGSIAANALRDALR